MNKQNQVVLTTPAFKLKDKEKRNIQPINLKDSFGVIPEIIVIEKVKGYNNAFYVRAIIDGKESKQ